MKRAIVANQDLNRVYTSSKTQSLMRGEPLDYDLVFKTLRYTAIDLDKVRSQTRAAKKRATNKAQCEAKAAAKKEAKEKEKEKEKENETSNERDNSQHPGHFPKDVWKRMPNVAKDAHMQKFKMGKYRQANAATGAPTPAPAPALAPAPAPVTTTEEPGGLLRSFLSANRASQNTNEFTFNGTTYCAVNRCDRTYRIEARSTDDEFCGSLVDGGCNGGLAGDDVLVIDSDHSPC